MVTKLLLVDDHPMMRSGVRQLLDMHDDLEVVGEAGSGEDALGIVERVQPDLILLDLNMKGMDGISTLIEMRKRDIQARIIMVTVSDDHSDVVAAIRAGADGYVLKDAEPEELVSAVREAAAGQLVVSSRLNRALAHALRGESPQEGDSLDKLTDREKEILKLITKGYANKLIANTLSITESTVKVHVKHLLKKLQLRSRVEAAIWGVENGLGR